MNPRNSKHIVKRLRVAGAAFVLALPGTVGAWTSKDGTLTMNGFIENATYQRFHGKGLSKVRNTGQLELYKQLGERGFLTDVTFNATLRGSYDAVYDINDDEYGDNAGGAVSHAAPVNPAFFEVVVERTRAAGAAMPTPINLVMFPDRAAVQAFTGNPDLLSRTPEYRGSFPGTGAIPLTGEFSPDNPNEGLKLLGSDLHGTEDGGVVMAVPVRPCDEDSRGCIDGYLDFDKDELASPEFNDRLDTIREAYFTANLPLANGDQVGFSFGRQQVVWGRTDLFRVLDVINPVDFSRNNIYDELEDIRYPMGILTAEYRWGATRAFDDINLQLLWKWEQFRPNNLGQGGTPNAIIDAGSFFRAMKNCWDNGCTVWNFPGPGIAVDFPKNVIGIRQANLPGWSLDNTDVGARLEGVYKGIGFSLNALYYHSHFPVLRGGIPADNPFVPVTLLGQSFPDDQEPLAVHPYLIAFDIDFPRIFLLGGSADFYLDRLKSSVRLEVAWTTGEEFANSLRPRLFSESDVVRYVVGWDRPTFIPFLNKNRSFLISAQLFGQHILDHELEDRPLGKIGIPDWENNWIGTLLVKGFYKSDRVSPQVIAAYDVRAQAAAVAPSLDWLISDRWRLTVGANLKLGTGAREFDDDRSANPFPPFTCATWPLAGSDGMLGSAPPPPECAAPFRSLGLGGYEPLGRFRSGPLGMSQNEDEVQLNLRYRF